MRRIVVLLVAAVAVVTVIGVVATASGGSVPPARVVAIVPSASGAKLTLLDARTLKPVRPGWSRAVPKDTLAALSPAVSRVAIGIEGSDGQAVLVVDSSTGRRLERHGVAGWENGLYWLGGDGTKGTPAPLLVSIGFHCGSMVCG